MTGGAGVALFPDMSILTFLSGTPKSQRPTLQNSGVTITEIKIITKDENGQATSTEVFNFEEESPE